MSDLERAIARMFCVGFDGPRMNNDLQELLERGVSSVILFSRNYESPAQLAELAWRIKTAADRPIMICVDQEGGRVQRFREPFTTIPSMRELGRARDAEAVRRVGRVIARELRAVNIDMNLAPVMDVDSNPDNPVIGERSLGRDPEIVAELGCALIDGLQQREHARGLAACAKHFPGHGDTSLDSHLDLPQVAHGHERLERLELPPFRAAIGAQVAAIMCAHVMFDALDAQFPATMSERIIRDLLRGKMKFEGVVCSDDLEMKAIIDHFGIEEAVLRGAVAGLDLFMVCKDHELQHRAIDALIGAVKRGEIAEKIVMQANRRLEALFDAYVRPGSRWSESSQAVFAAMGEARFSASRATS